MRIRALLVPASRSEEQGDEGVALLMSLALIGIFTTLMLTMLALVLSQVKPTAQARKDIGSLNAASSGLQAGLASLRTAVDVNGAGSRGRSVCRQQPSHVQSGAVSRAASGASLTGAASTLAGSFSYRGRHRLLPLRPDGHGPAVAA